MNHEKIKIAAIITSTISLIATFLLYIQELAWISIILCGIPIFKECIEGLKEFDIKADLLVTIAIISSIIIGEVFAAGEIATIMAIGGFLEEYTVLKTQRKIKNLAKIKPQKATRIINGKEEIIDVENVKIGDKLKVLPGESIPTDGVIIKGESSIDQSTLTGESIPADKSADDEVYSGTVNLYGSFIMKTTKISKESSLQKLINLIESTSPENAKIVRQADKWATFIVAIAFTSAILTYLLTFEIIRSVTILVVFCPCALVLATPTAIMAVIGNLTKYGILVKNGEAIEEMAHISEFVFDKTGTLTYGRAEVVNVISNNPEEMMYHLASLESKSEHPIAKAIMKYYNKSELAEVDNFKMHIGKGISGEINSSKIIVGSKKFIKSHHISIKNDEISKNGEIEIYIAKDNEYLGKVRLADTLRETSKDVIKSLKEMRIKTTLLTGDNRKTAHYIANLLKIRNVKSNTLPHDKTEYIKDEQIKGHRVAMIGDGVNDAASLRTSNVGIAMAEIGSDISVNSADIALINDNIENIPYLITLSKKCIKTINISIAFSLILNITAMALGILGVLNPIEGALIHNIGSLAVVGYSYTLTRYKISDTKSSEKLGIPKSLNKVLT